MNGIKSKANIQIKSKRPCMYTADILIQKLPSKTANTCQKCRRFISHWPYGIPCRFPKCDYIPADRDLSRHVVILVDICHDSVHLGLDFMMMFPFLSDANSCYSDEIKTIYFFFLTTIFQSLSLINRFSILCAKSSSFFKSSKRFDNLDV